MATNRTFTQAERDTAVRLKKTWNTKKSELHLTQEKMVQFCQWGNQSAFGAYLNSRVPLNTEAILKIAKVMSIHPTEIMPELEALLPRKDIQQESAGYNVNNQKTALQAIQSDYQIAKGLHDLSVDQALIDTMKITDEEFKTLQSIDLPKSVSKNDYLQLLITIRAVTE